MDCELDVGRHCKQCNLRDFLPVVCPHCHHDFCGSHLFEHSCNCAESTTTTTPTVVDEEKFPCSFCSQRSILTCKSCTKFTCSIHRFHDPCSPPTFPSSTISPPPAAKTRNPEARALLAKHFPPTREPNSIMATAIKSKAPGVHLMKMKHRAIPLVPQDASTAIRDRIHFKVVFGPQEEIFWCRNSLITGRAVDLIARRFNVPISGIKSAHLTSSTGEILRNDLTVSQIDNGATISFNPSQ